MTGVQTCALPIFQTLPIPQNSSISLNQETSIKTENLGAILSEFTEAIIEAINANSRPRPNAANPSNRMVDCNFCGGAHYIRDCAEVMEYVKAGKCKKNVEGKVVLPTGAFVPREIPGTLLRERVDEWHRRNPNQLAVASLINTIQSRIIAKVSPSPQVSIAAPVYQLSTKD